MIKEDKYKIETKICRLDQKFSKGRFCYSSKLLEEALYVTYSQCLLMKTKQNKKNRLAAIYQRDKELNHKKTAMQVYSGA